MKASFDAGAASARTGQGTARIPVDLGDVRRRARSAFLGLALGDALGAPVEFMTADEIRAQHGLLREMVGGGWLRLRPGQVTDDTEMSLCLARAIDAASGFDLRTVADRFAEWLRGGPVDVGNTVRRGIRRYLHEGTLAGPPADGDAGNGAAMRMVPVALATLGNGPLLAQLAVQQARVTHHHLLSDTASVHVGLLLHLAVTGHSLSRLRAASDALAAVHPGFRIEGYRGLATGYVVDTLRTVLHHFHRTRGFEECLVAVVNQGGDADTTGAIAGALAGAYYGPEELPARWLRKLAPALRAEIERLADRMVDLSPLARGEGVL
ncbi:MAG: ADP-ribosyl-[dinitrogen reductase] hydrolase [Deltaproteobacteria bacterium]|nr:ADP-ribosyl-[dinitrogen reductase] hydrolase [Deltaproteobacteria bacterium]